MKSRPVHYVLSQSGCTAFMQALAEVTAGRRVWRSRFWMDRELSGGPVPAYHSGGEALNQAVVELFGELVYRHNTAKDIVSGRYPPVYEPRLYLVNGVNRCLSQLTEDGKDKLHVLMEKCEVPLGVFLSCLRRLRGISALSLSGLGLKNRRFLIRLFG